MGHNGESTVFYVGMARLPQPRVAAVDTVTIELEVEARSGRIVAATASLKFPGFERLLHEILVGQPVGTVAGHALLELEVRYSASFTPALRTAVQAAVLRAMDGATGGNGRSPQRLTRSSP